mmetsp:Transcript_10923/g.18256  ORF Transcript_10923/g.18256 Transcript_10923/m.18256 type:complete len:102 (+) Transcript_10923:71-376(+)
MFFAIPEGITKADVEDPDNESNLVSMAYCEKMLEGVNQKIQECIKNQERIAPKLKQQMKDFTMGRNKVMQGCQTGAIQPEDYVRMLENLLSKDILVAKHLS